MPVRQPFIHSVKPTIERPCTRCVKRRIGHLCTDGPRKDEASGNTRSTKSSTCSSIKLESPTIINNTPPEQMEFELQALSDFLDLYQVDPSKDTGPNIDAATFDASTATVISSENSTERFILTAADPSALGYPNRLHEVIDAKFEAGFLRPYDYPAGYARLQKYMEGYISTAGRTRIMDAMSAFRPKFRAIAHGLTDFDLVMVEESFDHILMDYERLFSTVATPACLWRRTGEIYHANREFARLVLLPVSALRDGRTALHELMTEESVVNYWEKFAAISFDSGQKAILSTCVLKSGGQAAVGGDALSMPCKKIRCCFSFTIKRDAYNLPTCIIGNFLPSSVDPAS